MKWYIDLDDTLFDTTYAYGQMCRVAADLYDIKLLVFAIRMLRNRQKFKFGGSRRGCLRYFYTLRSFGIDDNQARELIFKRLNGKDFLYKDAKKLLTWLKQQGIEPVILTFGDKETQEFKMSLVPEIAGFKKVVVQEPKQNYIKSLPKHDSILIDDKPVEDLPDWCRGVLILRRPQVAAHGSQTILSLTELIK